MRAFWLILGGAALLLGALGVALPVLPTTPFVILAAFAFGKSSPRLHQWLINLPAFGPMIKDWEAHGAIPVRAKMIACSMMAAVFAISLYVGVPRVGLIAQAIGMSIGAGYVLTRPSGPKKTDQNKDI
ncbi:YbaN family protein [Planktotalea sp.]|uniref:YbaN family protein n=1 Tax=Planktotalea sp. TaxID=2029877 RepID=UPI003298A9C4